MTSSNSEAGPALKVDEIRDLPPAALSDSVSTWETHQKTQPGAPLQTSGILLLLLQVLNLIIQFMLLYMLIF